MELSSCPHKKDGRDCRASDYGVGVIHELYTRTGSEVLEELTKRMRKDLCRSLLLQRWFLKGKWVFLFKSISLDRKRKVRVVGRVRVGSTLEGFTNLQYYS